MEASVRKYHSHAQAAAEVRDFYRSLTAEERMEIFFDLLAQGRDYTHEAAQGFPRVHRIVKRPQR